jgi:hypothetical protein
MVLKYEFYTFQNNFYTIVVYITWILYFAIALGISVNAPEYLNTLQSFMKIYISLFLIYRFNSFRTVKFTDYDAKISFSAGLFLLGTTAIDGILKYYISYFKQLLNKTSRTFIT